MEKQKIYDVFLVLGAVWFIVGFLIYQNSAVWPLGFIFLIIGPATSTSEYLLILSKISKMLSRKLNRVELLQAKSTNKIRQIFADIKDRDSIRNF